MLLLKLIIIKLKVFFEKMRYYVQVITGSSLVKIEKIGEGDLKVWLTAKPVKGEANQQLLKVLADYFSVAKSRIDILAGKTTKKKLVEII